MNGKVKFFSAEKGFGFITGEDGKDYFAHYSQIKADGYRSLNDGQDVTFDVEVEAKGPKAVNIEAK